MVVVTFVWCATRGEAGEPAPGSGITQQLPVVPPFTEAEPEHDVFAGLL